MNKKKEALHNPPCPFCEKSREEWFGIFHKDWVKIKEIEKNAHKKGSMDKKKVIKNIESILESSKSSYEKKIALFELVEGIEFEDIEPEENEKVNYLLRSRIFNEIAKENYKRYQKAAVDEFTKDK